MNMDNAATCFDKILLDCLADFFELSESKGTYDDDFKINLNIGIYNTLKVILEDYSQPETKDYLSAMMAILKEQPENIYLCNSACTTVMVQMMVTHKLNRRKTTELLKEAYDLIQRCNKFMQLQSAKVKSNRKRKGKQSNM